MIFKVDHGKFVNWTTIMYSQLVKKLIRWDKCQKNMIEGITKKKPKKIKCHYTIRRSIIIEEKKTSKTISRGQKKKK
jgi:hypothetical protein